MSLSLLSLARFWTAGCAILYVMSVERVDDFGAVALMAATRDLTAPLVLLRQLSFQLESQPEFQQSLTTRQALEQMRLTIKRTFDIAGQLRLAVGDTEQLSLEPIQLAGLCDDLQSELRPLQRELRRSVDFELPGRGQVVAVGNYQALRTVMNGLLTDALHYSGQNRDNNRRTVRLRVATSRRGQVAISVSDDAPGINLAQSLHRATEPAEVNPTGNRPLMGSLNLLLADRLVRAMNGKLLVHNHRRGGMTIETCLPISRQLSLLEAT